MTNVTTYAIFHLKEFWDLTRIRYIKGVTAKTAGLAMCDVHVAEEPSHISSTLAQQYRVGLSVLILRPPGRVLIETDEVSVIDSFALEMTGEAISRTVVFRRVVGCGAPTRLRPFGRLRGAAS
jgi:hypothetical protein